MDTKNVHLTDMARDLQKDHSGAYRRKLLDILYNYRQKFNELEHDGNIKNDVLISIRRAFTCAETIITMEE